jgi:membrane-bound serine protease (ClpP class)
MKKKWLFLWFLLLPFFAVAKDGISKPLIISLKGHLEKERVQNWQQQIMALDSPREIILELDSSSGDLESVVHLSQTLYEKRQRGLAYVILYISGQAQGPSALLPFLSDELYTSSNMSWGHILKDGEQQVLAVLKFKDALFDKIENPAFQVLFSSMLDGAVYPIEVKGGWELAARDASEPLVLTQDDLRKFGISNKIMTDDVFISYYLEGRQKTFPSPSKENIESNLQRHISYHAESNAIGYIRLQRDRPIDNTTYIYVKYALEHFRKLKVPFVLLDLDTPGGEVFASLRIVQELTKMDSVYHIPVVAFIDKWALSAGALLAYSCRFIAVTPGSNMGAAEPVIMNAEGQMQTASEKMISALRTEFANAAEFYNRDPLIAEAMVDKDLILVWRNGKVVRLRNESQIIDEGATPDIIITTQGKLLTLNADQMIQLSVADLEVRPGTNPEILPAVTYQEQKNETWSASDNLLFQYPFFAKIPHASLVEYSNWKIDFFSVLTHPFVSSALIIGLLIGIYGEIQNPGFGLFGGIALVCLALIVLSSFAAEVVNWLEIIILISGLFLILVDIIFMAGFGFVGGIGILFALAGLIAMLLPPLQEYPFSFDMSHWGMWTYEIVYRLSLFLGSVLLSFVFMLILGKFIFKRKMFMRRFVLVGDQMQEGVVAVGNKPNLPPIGTRGIALSALRPFGKVIIDDRIYEALSENEFIEKEDLIYVVRHQGEKIVVTSKEILK